MPAQKHPIRGAKDLKAYRFFGLSVQKIGRTMALITQLPNPTLDDSGDPAGELAIPIVLQVSEATTSTYRGKIRRVEKGFFQLWSPVWVNTNARLEILIDDCRIMADVISCHEHKPGDYRLAARRTYGPQRAIRSEPRIPVQLAAIVRTPYCDKITAKVIDMSQSGLGLELSTEVEAGTRVVVEFMSGTAFGEVRHCKPLALTYRAGMRIDEFVIRKGTDPGKSQAPQQIRIDPSGGVRVRRLIELYCLLVGHEYHWCEDAWSRPVLRCTRCYRDLDASMQ
jgi:hypothetical protein